MNDRLATTARPAHSAPSARIVARTTDTMTVLLEGVAPAPEVSPWIAIAYQAPPPETDVLCRRDPKPPIVAGLFRGEWFSFENKDAPLHGITHWMPLPLAHHAAPIAAEAVVWQARAKWFTDGTWIATSKVFHDQILSDPASLYEARALAVSPHHPPKDANPNQHHEARQRTHDESTK